MTLANFRKNTKKGKFLNWTLLVESTNGLDDLLKQPLIYISHNGKRYRAPSESTTDGMSTPWLVRAIPGFQPFGKHWFSAVLHDSAYRGTLEKLTPDGWVPARLTRHQADLLFHEALLSQGVGPVRAKVIFVGVCVGGRRHFSKTS